MTLEDELADLREHVRELQDLVVSIIPDDRVARLEERNLLHRTIAERANTGGFDLHRRYADGGRYVFVVTPAYRRTTIDPAVVAYVDRLRRLGMEIAVEGNVEPVR